MLTSLDLQGQVPIKKNKRPTSTSFDKEVEKQSKNEEMKLRKIKPHFIPNKKCLCRNNIIRNGNFRQGTDTSPGSRNIGSGSSQYTAQVNHWNKGTNTPRYASSQGYATPGLVSMWGNKVVSESIWQKVSIKKGRTYKGCFSFKFNPHQQRRPDHIRFKLRASKNANLNSPACPTNNCGIITTSQTIYHQNGWQTHYFEWVANDNYNFLYVTPENNSTINGPQHISGGWFDDLCIEEKKCVSLKPYTGFELIDIKVEGNRITHVEFKSNLSIPNGATHWWNIYEGNDCTNNNDYSYTNTELRNTDFDDTFIINSPSGNFPILETNKCYIIKHGLYYSDDPVNKECGWEEKRAKLKVIFSAANLRVGKPTVEFKLENGSMKKEKKKKR